MNEIITKEMVEKGICTDEVLDLVEEIKTLQDRLDTVKFQFKQIAETYGIKKYETDYFRMTYIAESDVPRINSERMKNETIMVVDALTGELDEVNAYDYFKTTSHRKAYVKYEEKK